MARDMFNEAEANFANAEKSLTAFWSLIKKPFIFLLDKISNFLDKIFQGEDETTQFQLKKLPL